MIALELKLSAALERRLRVGLGLTAVCNLDAARGAMMLAPSPYDCDEGHVCPHGCLCCRSP